MKKNSRKLTGLLWEVTESRGGGEGVGGGPGRCPTGTVARSTRRGCNTDQIQAGWPARAGRVGRSGAAARGPRGGRPGRAWRRMAWSGQCSTVRATMQTTLHAAVLLAALASACKYSPRRNKPVGQPLREAP